MPLRPLARGVLVTVRRSSTLAEVARLMDRRNMDVAVVAEQERPVGVVTTHDIVVRGVAHRFPADARIDTVMTDEVVTLPADASRREAADALREHGVAHLVLIDHGAPVAVLTREDLVVELAAELAEVTGTTDPA
jgi:CBS domain-containing protein